MARVTLLVVWLTLSSCRANVPQITCQAGLAEDECQTAASLAEALLGDQWASATYVSIADGVCSHWQHGCPPTRLEQSLGLFATVDVETQDGRHFSIGIDRQTEPWSPSCSEFVTTLGGRETHTEPCAVEASSS